MDPESQPKRLPVVEIFYSIQGEGHYTGRPAIFIRFGACNLACPWCDTDFSKWEKKEPEQIAEEALSLLPPLSEDTEILIVYTGGEPSLYAKKLPALSNALRCRRSTGGCFISMETNGLLLCDPYVRGLKVDGHVDFFTVSPKFSQSDYTNLLKDNDWEGDELKVVMDPEHDLNTIRTLPYLLCGRFKHFYIQPLSCRYQEAFDFVRQNPEWRLSIQTQKVIGAR